MIKISRNVQHGSEVTLRGDKYIKASIRTKRVVGVFNSESLIKGISVDGERFFFEIPAGIRTYGEADAKKEARE